MKKDTIRLHEKYGLNPTIPICYLCGKERNEIALRGADYKEETPKDMVIDRVPCQECEERLVEYAAMIEMESEEAGVTTGRVLWIKRDRLTPDDREQKIFFIERELAENLQLVALLLEMA